MKKQYFGTDGIRGKVGVLPITPDFMVHLANATGQILKQQFGRATVLIAKDTRVSGYMLESALEAGFCSAGVDVILCGPLPTAGVAYLTRALRLQLGVVISASHNPFEDNGIKFFSAQGLKLSDAFEFEIEQKLSQPMVFEGLKLGKVKRLDDAQGRYVEFCKSTFDDYQLQDFDLTIDCANGAAYQVAPMVFNELGAKTDIIHNQPNGFNINLDCGATDCKSLQQKMLAKFQEESKNQNQNQDQNQNQNQTVKHILGIALDGDADRLQIIDQHQKLYAGDELLYILARYYLHKGLPLKKVVGTVMTNAGVEKALNQHGIELIRTAVGDRYILEQLQNLDLQLGAEGSGHILCFDKHSTGDGIIAALQVLSAIKHLGDLADICKDVHLHEQVLLNVKLPNQNLQIEDLANFQKAIQQANTKLQNQQNQKNGRILIRKSGTEAKLRIMVEASDAKLAQDMAQELYDVCQSDLKNIQNIQNTKNTKNIAV